MVNRVGYSRVQFECHPGDLSTHKALFSFQVKSHVPPRAPIHKSKSIKGPSFTILIQLHSFLERNSRHHEKNVKILWKRSSIFAYFLPSRVPKSRLHSKQHYISLPSLKPFVYDNKEDCYIQDTLNHYTVDCHE